jgi:hypothetical protein
MGLRPGGRVVLIKRDRTDVLPGITLQGQAHHLKRARPEMVSPNVDPTAAPGWFGPSGSCACAPLRRVCEQSTRA